MELATWNSENLFHGSFELVKTGRWTDSDNAKLPLYLINHQAKKTYGDGGIVPHSPESAVDVSSQLHALSDLPPGKQPPEPIRHEAGWVPHRKSGRGGEEEILPTAGNRTPVVHPIA
jgi:hypothetical protein